MLVNLNYTFLLHFGFFGLAGPCHPTADRAPVLTRLQSRSRLCYLTFAVFHTRASSSEACTGTALQTIPIPRSPMVERPLSEQGPCSLP